MEALPSPMDDTQGWMPKDWSYLRESPSWRERHPLGPVHFDIRLGNKVVARDVPAPKLPEMTKLAYAGKLQ